MARKAKLKEQEEKEKAEKRKQKMYVLYLIVLLSCTNHLIFNRHDSIYGYNILILSVLSGKSFG